MPVLDTGGFPRVSPTAFTGVTVSMVVLATTLAIYRTYLQLRSHHRLDSDDYCLVFANAALIAVVSYTCANRDQFYGQVSVSLGISPVPADIIDLFVAYLKLETVMYVLQWCTIYSIKLSYLLFFKKLLVRVRPSIHIWWWIVTVVLGCSAITSIVFPFYICSDFGSDVFEVCGIEGLFDRQNIYLHTTIALDILTDLLIISIPISLLWGIQMIFRRKVAIIVVLSLSGVMIIIASIRVALAQLPGDITDTTWLCFWTNIEASVSIIMVSITAFRSLFGQEQKSRTTGSSGGRRNLPASNGSSKGTNDRKAGGMQPINSSVGLRDLDDDLDIYMKHDEEMMVIPKGVMTKGEKGSATWSRDRNSIVRKESSSGSAEERNAESFV